LGFLAFSFAIAFDFGCAFDVGCADFNVSVLAMLQGVDAI
jgi:hypothetical protein